MDRRKFIKKTALATAGLAGAAITSPVSAMLKENETVAQKKVKVLLLNGSPRADGNTFCCLKEIETQLQKHGVETEIVQIGQNPVRMCINCGGCRDGEGCVFDDDLCNVIAKKMETSDALIVGTPVYYGQPNGGILSLMQRLFFSAGHLVPKGWSDGDAPDHEHDVRDDEHACSHLTILEHCIRRWQRGGETRHRGYADHAHVGQQHGVPLEEHSC